MIRIQTEVLCFFFHSRPLNVCDHSLDTQLETGYNTIWSSEGHQKFTLLPGPHRIIKNAKHPSDSVSVSTKLPSNPQVTLSVSEAENRDKMCWTVLLFGLCLPSGNFRWVIEHEYQISHSEDSWACGVWRTFL